MAAETKSDYFGTFITFVALLLQIFVIISGSANLPVLRDVYFAVVEYHGNFMRAGFWGSCYGVGSTVKECSVPHVPFRWYSAEGLNMTLDVGVADSVYLAIFILYWMAFGALGLAMIASTFSYFKRLPAIIVAFCSLMATGAIFIVFVIVVVTASKLRNAANNYGDPHVSGNFGPGPWLMLGSVLASGIATLYYIYVCLCRPRARETFKF